MRVHNPRACEPRAARDSQCYKMPRRRAPDRPVAQETRIHHSWDPPGVMSFTPDRCLMIPLGWPPSRRFESEADPGIASAEGLRFARHSTLTTNDQERRQTPRTRRACGTAHRALRPRLGLRASRPGRRVSSQIVACATAINASISWGLRGLRILGIWFEAHPVPWSIRKRAWR